MGTGTAAWPGHAAGQAQEGPAAPVAWTWGDAAEACFREAKSPSTFGGQMRSWDTAGRHYRAAQQAQERGDYSYARVCAANGAVVLRKAGLRLGMTVPPPPQAAPHARQQAAPQKTERTAPPPPQHKAAPPQTQWSRMVAVCTVNKMRLTDAANKRGALAAAEAAALYGAAGALERAAREWACQQSTAASTWMDTAAALLRTQLLPVPWHDRNHNA